MKCKERFAPFCTSQAIAIPGAQCPGTAGRWERSRWPGWQQSGWSDGWSGDQRPATPSPPAPWSPRWCGSRGPAAPLPHSPPVHTSRQTMNHTAALCQLVVVPSLQALCYFPFIRVPSLVPLSCEGGYIVLRFNGVGGPYHARWAELYVDGRCSVLQPHSSTAWTSWSAKNETVKLNMAAAEVQRRMGQQTGTVACLIWFLSLCFHFLFILNSPAISFFVFLQWKGVLVLLKYLLNTNTLWVTVNTLIKKSWWKTTLQQAASNEAVPYVCMQWTPGQGPPLF